VYNVKKEAHLYEVWIKKRGKIMRKAAAAGIILAGAILVAGGLDKESGSENFVAAGK